MTEYDVFISFKYHDANGATTRDFEIANELYTVLKTQASVLSLAKRRLLPKGRLSTRE